MGRLDRFYFGTNTKMYKTIAETASFLTELANRTRAIDRGKATLFVIPSFTTLQTAGPIAHEGGILLGAQNMGWEAEGPFTGEISPRMLREVGVQIVEIGHSERRHVLNETDEMENKKVLCALANGFQPLLCIGETAEQKRDGIASEILRIQLKRDLRGVSPAQAAESLMIAYEPVWAIGAGGTPATKEYAEEKHAVIRAAVCELFGEKDGGQIPVLYGGSVNADNAVGLAETPGIDGLFIGRSAWEAERFAGIIASVLDKR